MDDFNRQDISNFYIALEPNIKHPTINWRIYTLTQNGIINRIGRGKYTLQKGVNFLPEISHKSKLISNKLKKQFPFLTICLWSSSLLNEFAIHQINQSFLLIEVEKDATQSIFRFLKEKKHPVFVEPSKDIIEKYATCENNYIIVKPLVSEAPIKNIQGVSTVALEKILVDIFCDKIIFSAYQGNEMKTIFLEAYAKYSINESKLLRYAARRGRRNDIKNYINLINGK